MSEKTDEAAAERYANPANLPGVLPEIIDRRKAYLAGCRHKEAQLNESLKLTQEFLNAKESECDDLASELAAKDAEITSLKGALLAQSHKHRAEIARLRTILEMKLPECSCYRSIGQCERCRILEPLADKAGEGAGK